MQRKTATRRTFLKMAAASGSLYVTSRGFAEGAAVSPYTLVAATDKARILRLAQQYLAAPAITVTAAQCDRSAGGLHDFYSEGDYWWPDEKNPKGPYVRRDGFTNPQNFNAHREAMVRMSLIVPALAAAWELTGDKRYSRHAGKHLRAWFVDAATKMNANLEYAQAIFGVNKGRGVGMIDTLHLVEPARAATVLMERSALEGAKEIQAWFAAYLEWMRTSTNGKEERDARNNHGSCWVMQAAEFARFAGNTEVMAWCRERFKTVLVPDQIAADGSLPLELSRTKPYSYCLFDFDVMGTICQTISTAKDNLWQFETADGRGMRKLTAFLYPYIKDRAKWPYRHDVEHFEDFPVRNPSLLFAGEAYGRAEYIATWKTLNPDPIVPEVIRNYPVRQPLLWMPHPMKR